MPSQLPPSFSRPFLKIYHVLEAMLLVAITLATVFAMVEEFIHMFVQKAGITDRYSADVHLFRSLGDGAAVCRQR